jgi:Asp-tRNA(Asn)/Glu-tRNA(Gln) amidotransferase A subunit family amidase
MSDPAALSATEATRRVRAGTLDAVALMEAWLDRIAAREPAVRAFAAFDADQARRAVARPGVLQGLPVGVKDVLDTADYPSEYGSPIWRGNRPRADAAAVAWMRAAGGVVVGKTVTTEFATRLPGPTANPVNPAHTPGGSSSGSAAGVGAGMFPLAFGTQTAGSIIRPAAFCGVVGYKPSYGMIPRLGMKVMSHSLDTIGTMARSVADAALLAGAAGLCDLGDPQRKPERAPRIGICRSPAWGRAAAETQDLFAGLAGRLAGAAVADRELPAAFDGLLDAHAVVMGVESAASMGWELTFARDGISDVLRERLEWGLSQTDKLPGALAVFASSQAAFAGVMEGLDVLVTPSAVGEAPAGLEWTGDPVFNSIWTALGVPCVTVPAGPGPNGLPLGVQVVARMSDDAAVLAWAAWVEAALAR